jgi:hypothetical protein
VLRANARGLLEVCIVSCIVQRDDGAGARLRARIRWMTVVSAYRAVGKVVSKRYDRATPFIVAQAVRLARPRGWHHDHAGPEHDFGWLDDLVDWASLAPSN